MKKFIGNLTTTLLVLLLVWVIASTVEVNSKKDTNPNYSAWNCWCVLLGERTQEGTYYNGTIITADGHVWGYSTDLEDGTLVTVCFDTQYTLDVADDIITHVGH